MEGAPPQLRSREMHAKVSQVPRHCDRLDGAAHARLRPAVLEPVRRREADRAAAARALRDRRRRVPALAERAARSADRRRQSRRDAAQRERNLSVHAGRHPCRRDDHHLRDLYLLVGHVRPGVCRRAQRARGRRRQDPRAAGLGRLHEDGSQVARRDARCGLRGRALSASCWWSTAAYA